ncbi:MAG: UDP-N-acetylmuramoyl-L-alanyl-D-glutamate--2,6-diaminopimelate ligase [Treponema sp.]|nr:UDP-N-acetylmuramoyl-L-alanyl-D-glutamate--2,6-diaminopimelate ligase [Treponema sp.]MCL2271901.1 UDP-N-acetylmuramoyl-L-alanyl-D-glutamate--2,6-diaminopimelate ligase [Treponema sp.]
MERRLSEFFTDETADKAGLAASNVKTDLVKKDPVVTDLQYDSRNVKNGSLFFALPGLHTDGSIFIDDAISKGASVIVHENEIHEKKPDVVYLKVKDSRFAMSPVSASFYDFPSRRLLVTGVTGTEGKSTTVYLIWQLLTLLGEKAGFFSTVQRSLGKEVIWNSEHQTTPEAPVVQRLLYEMANNGCRYAVIEASSHGLSKKTNRLGDVEFCSAVLTNITHEHLEFHGTWEQYREDKANLFRALDNYIPGPESDFSGPFGVINADDKSLRFFADATRHKIFKYSASGREADIVITAFENSAWGNWYNLYIPAAGEFIDVRDRLTGSFNAHNILAALLAVSGLLKLPVRKITPYINKLKPVRGRMTSINRGQPFEVVVDYAHTPSSFQAVFPPLRSRLNKTGGRIISVFGSAGERDTQKRAQQGEIASGYSDIIILTDEDPRGENPMDIIEDIAKGIEENKTKEFRRGENLFLIADRLAAIRKALNCANRGDMVLLLGKGHENSIIYADHVMPFDEITEAEKALSENGYR